jgi:hypothetical protein
MNKEFVDLITKLKNELNFPSRSIEEILNISKEARSEVAKKHQK